MRNILLTMHSSVVLMVGIEQVIKKGDPSDLGPSLLMKATILIIYVYSLEESGWLSGVSTEPMSQ